MNAATLLAAAAIIDARVANGGMPHWRRIADELTTEAVRLAEAEDVGLDVPGADGARRGAER